MSKITVLVTGAGGFIGQKVVERLLSQEYVVYAMIRPETLPPYLPHKNLKILYADILDYQSYVNSVREVDVIVHLAANKYHPKLSYLVNIQGAKNIIRLIKEKKIKGKRIINISSQSTKIKWKGVYGQSKDESDKIIQIKEVDWTTIKPSLVYGDDKKTLFGTIVYFTKNLPFVPLIGNGRWELYPVTVEDVAKAIELAIKKKNSIHKIYDLGSLEKITFDQLIKLIQKQLGIKKPIIHIPFLLGLLMVKVATFIFPKLPISVDNVLGSNQNTNFNGLPIIKDLGIKPISVQEGVKKYLNFNDKKNNKVKIAIVGLGKMGILHISVLKALPNVEITALIDRDKALIKTVQSMGVKAAGYLSLEEALMKEDIQAVFICTPTFAHKEIIDVCIRKKLPFFVEKPVLNNIKYFSGDIKNYQKPNAAGYFWLYRREIEYTKNLIETGKIGKIITYKVILKHSEVFGKKSGWLFKKNLSGGGVLINPGPHAFSIIFDWFGKAEIVSSKLESVYSEDIEDKAIVKFIHNNGIKGELNANWSVKGYPILTIEYLIEGSLGKIIFKNNRLTIISKKLNQSLAYYAIPYHYQVFNLNPKAGGEAYYVEDKLFIESVVNKNLVRHNLSFAYEVESLIAKAYEKNQ